MAGKNNPLKINIMNRNRGNRNGNGNGNGNGTGNHDGQGLGRGMGHGGGRGRNNGGGFGLGGYCVCAKCDTKVKHAQGIKCTDLKCPECGHTMIREELLAKNRV